LIQKKANTNKLTKGAVRSYAFYFYYVVFLVQKMKKYLTGTVMSDGRFVPMGWSKDWDNANEVAKEHGHIICELTVVEDYREVK